MTEHFRHVVRGTGPGLLLAHGGGGSVEGDFGAGLERFAILGYSLGTAVAVRATTRHPDRVTGLVLTSGFARLDNRIRLAVDVWAALLHDDPKFLTLVASGRDHLEALTPGQLVTAVDQLAAIVPDGSPEHVALVAKVDTRAELAGIAVPALVVATTLDGLASPALSRELADGIPGAELVEIEAGHNIGAEARDEWLAAIEEFLGRLS